MLSHPFESFIFIDKALLDLIRWVFIIFYCSAYVWRKIWANMLVHVVLKLPHIEPHSLEFLPYLVSLPSVFSPLFCPPHYCIRFLTRIPQRRPLCPLCSGASLLLAPFLGMLQTHLTLHLPLPTKGLQERPPSPINCRMFWGPDTCCPPISECASYAAMSSLLCGLWLLLLAAWFQRGFQMLKPDCPRISKFSKLSTTCVSLLRLFI